MLTGLTEKLLCCGYATEIFEEDFAQEWARQHGRHDLLALKGRSPYASATGWRGNLAAVFGTRSLLVAVLPSLRLPAWPPFGEAHWIVPIAGVT